MKDITDKLCRDGNICDGELKMLIQSEENDRYLFEKADAVRKTYYGNRIFIRGLIEISNYCKNNCLYCGIRSGNTNAVRYRLEEADILECCKTGYGLGFRTFVLQGGEDPYFDDKRICSIVEAIKSAYGDCAVTLSLGEKSRESYKAYFDSGADRYLLRHETADNAHYSRLHPENMNPENRKKCLFDLKNIGYQVGSGFMVGSPYQTVDNLVADLRFLQELEPDMIGIGPFIHHADTPFAKFSSGSVEMTLRLIAIMRIMFPKALIPATTALGSLSPDGRERGIKAGANVVMPNLSPESVRELYSLYNNKAHSGSEAAEGLRILKRSMENIGYEIVTDRGDRCK